MHPTAEANEYHPVTQPAFTLLYDHECPFCRLEVEWLLRRDRQQRLRAIDISAPDFRAADYGLGQEEVHARLHGVTGDGVVVEGMAAIRGAWSAVGLGWVMAPTAWPVLRWFADLGYRWFAKNRVRLGRLFGRRCDTGSCDTGSCALPSGGTATAQSRGKAVASRSSSPSSA